MSVSCTQAEQCELYSVSAHNPEQAENTDAVQAGVTSSCDGWGGAKNTLASGL